ncbi:SDR family oxidoreductase [Nocardioides litoris]|uniref:SDR family oxidoreductase n=1 Tax=Nocardioides litoris TaxID=1926648 RepID=UPI0011238E61|nr:SDR family oxidoreductase [Nocardioides litoris]
MTTSLPPHPDTDTAATAKTAVVVGGTSGMGRAVAQLLLDRGEHVIVTTRDSTGRSAEELRAAGASVVTSDITTEDGFDTVISALAGGTVDHLVLSAAHLQYKPFREFSAEEASSTVVGKLMGYWRVVHQVAPALAADASVVLFSGVAASRPGPGTAAVTAANAGIEGLGRSLAIELAPVRVNVLNPGIFDTPSWSEMPEAERRAFFESTAGSVPAGRVGEPADAAHAVAFLLDNPHVTGTTLTLDGGGLLV